MAIVYLIYQNGEACVSCPITCTEGLVALLEYYADTPGLKKILTHCKEGINGEFAIGSQFLSGIQGGSEKVALFIVPAWLEGNKDKERSACFCRI
ncbi:MAG: hypothetical protein K8S13_12575 [Desulfobacula sp.]|uniref:hypothetical protein n=1 Tax=Desulfobacula sp. TaxID=2593537 RepID=UPI0025C08FF1|nr:hypothetical protein [Desulfobacula sp.]MCD4720673.1 hypothetical protein [Desulfobacula sp.]